MKNKLFKSTFFLFVLQGLVLAEDSPWSSLGHTQFEYRRFVNERDNDQFSSGLTTEQFKENVSFLHRLAVKYQSGMVKAQFSGFGRLDSRDKERNFLFVEDFYTSIFFEGEQYFSAGVGHRVYNWSAMEAFHPTDIINGRNLDSDVENFEKRGELSLELEYSRGDNQFKLFVWPYPAFNKYPSSKSRAGTGVSIEDHALANSSGLQTERWQTGWGFLGNFNILDADVSMHWIYTYDRAHPLIGYETQTIFGNVLPTGNLKSFYGLVHQFGGTISRPINELMVKLEMVYRDYVNADNIYTTNGIRQFESHGEIAFGLEYSIEVESLGHDVTLFGEVNTLTGLKEEIALQTSVFQKDLLMGMRWNFNDANAKEISLISILDLDQISEKAIIGSYSQRLDDFWKLKLGMRYYDAKDENGISSGFEAYHEDHLVYTNLIRYF